MLITYTQSLEEYKLSAMKEPLVADFVEQFLFQHNLSENSIPSPISSRSRTSSPAMHSGHRLSQAELLDYSHQQQLTPSPGPSFSQPLTPTEGTPPQVNRPSLPHRMSRGASMPSLDVAMTSM